MAKAKPRYEPTPEQIAAECEKIKAEKQAQEDDKPAVLHYRSPREHRINCEVVSE